MKTSSSELRVKAKGSQSSRACECRWGSKHPGARELAVRPQQICSVCFLSLPRGLQKSQRALLLSCQVSLPSDIESPSITCLQSCPQGTRLIAYWRGLQTGLLVSQCVPVFQSLYLEPRHSWVSLKQTKFESQPSHLFTISTLLPHHLRLFL